MAIKIIAFVFPLCLDTLALSLALGLRGLRPWRPAVLFAIFEAVMPLFGIILAQVVSRHFEAAAVIAGGVILIVIGLHAIHEALQGGEKEAEKLSFASIRSMIAAGLAISTDELAIGFPLAASHLPLAPVLITIAVQTLLVTVLGITLGKRARSALSARASRYARITAGLIFTALGVWLITERLLG